MRFAVKGDPKGKFGGFFANDAVIESNEQLGANQSGVSDLNEFEKAHPNVLLVSIFLHSFIFAT